MPRKTLVALPLLALVAACGGGSDIVVTNENNVVLNDAQANYASVNDGEMAANDMMAVAPTDDQGFASTAAASDAFEIASGNLAREKATVQGLKDFGAMMVADHTKSTADLKAAAANVPGVTPNPALNAEQQANLDALRAASGTQFDTLYKAQQVDAHTKALTALQSYAAGGTAQPFKDFATKTAPVVEKHLGEIRGM